MEQTRSAENNGNGSSLNGNEHLVKELAEVTGRKNEFLERMMALRNQGLDTNPLKIRAEMLIVRENELRGKLGLSQIPNSEEA